MKKKTAELDSFIDKINDEFGVGTIVRGNDAHWVRPVSRISTSSLHLDAALGGGIPRGRMTQLFGKESSTKSTLGLLVCREAQKLGERCMMIVLEADFDPIWAEAHGVNLDLLDVAYPPNANVAADVLETATRTDDYGVVVFDSVAAGVTLHELERSATQDERGVGAKLTNKMLRKTAAALNAKTKGRPNQTAVILINQMRTSIGPYTADYCPGGRGLDYMPSVHIKLGWTRSEDDSDDEDIFADLGVSRGEEKKASAPVARNVKFLVAKNKTFRQGLSGQFRFFFVDTVDNRPLGVDVAEEVWRLGSLTGMLKVSGAWTQFPDGSKVQGMESAVDWLYARPEQLATWRAEILAKLLERVVKHRGSAAAVPAVEAEGEAAEAEPEVSRFPAKKLDAAPVSESSDEISDEAVDAAIAAGIIARRGPAWFEILAEKRKVRRSALGPYLNGGVDEASEDGGGGTSEPLRDEAAEASAEEPPQRKGSRKKSKR